MQVDKGAIPHVMKGAAIMCPGFTSKGGKIDAELSAETYVVGVRPRILFATEPTLQAVMAEGKQHALGIGLTKMSTSDM